MVGYGGIRDAVESLSALLRAHITNSGEAGLSGVPVRIGSPREIELANVANAVAVWLHRVDIQADLINRNPPRPDPDHEFRRPLPVELAIQVVPLNSDASTALLLLGRVFQVLSDHRRLAGSDLSGSLATSGTVLLVALGLPGVYDLNLLWAGQQTITRPGVAVTLSGLVVDSHLDPVAGSRVMDAAAGIAQIVGVAP
jgi:Pvc16 N-terminal domain